MRAAGAQHPGCFITGIAAPTDHCCQCHVGSIFEGSEQWGAHKRWEDELKRSLVLKPGQAAKADGTVSVPSGTGILMRRHCVPLTERHVPGCHCTGQPGESIYHCQT